MENSRPKVRALEIVQDSNTDTKNRPPNEFDDDGNVKRRGTVWTASAHIITAVIGSGVLSLAWSVAQLGWIAGPIILVCFAVITYSASLLLTDCYRHPGPIEGKRNYTYMDAVKAHLGGKQIWFCGMVQYLNLLGTAIGYTITASISMVAIKRSNCFHTKGHDAACHVSNTLYMCLFGAVQIVLSQIPNIHEISWLSIVAAIMSFSYSGIGLGLAIEKATEKNHSYGSMTGVSVGISEAQKIWRIFQALGNIAFAYAFSMILIEIEDTVKSSPPESETMRKATFIGVTVTTLFYMSVGCIGYAAFGDAAPGNLMTGFGFYDPYWLIDFANVCIVIHLVGAYQVFCQPLFAFVEGWVRRKQSEESFWQEERKIGVTLIPGRRWEYKFTVFRVLWRTLFVVVTTVVAMLLPFFNDIMGLLGAAAFWPLTVYFPISMHISQTRLQKWGPRWICLQLISALCLIVSLAAGAGSIVGLIDDLKKYTPFKLN